MEKENAPKPSRRRAALRDSRAAIGAELAAVVCLALILDNTEALPSTTPILVLIGWLSLRLRGLRWRSVGLARPASWRSTLLLGGAVGVAWQFFALYVREPLLGRLTGSLPDVSGFFGLRGDVAGLLFFLTLSWVLAAFGEELTYRGYLMNRAADLFGGSVAGWAVALVLVSVVFGLAHTYQGPSGIINSSISGLFFGALYLANRRNLWLPILAHGVNDTLGFVLIFLGLYPGM